MVEGKYEKTGRKKRTQILAPLPPAPRGAPAAGRRRRERAGRRYLIQHSASSGKSNSIAWLAHQLIGLAKDNAPVFDSIPIGEWSRTARGVLPVESGPACRCPRMMPGHRGMGPPYPHVF